MPSELSEATQILKLNGQFIWKELESKGRQQNERKKKKKILGGKIQKFQQSLKF